MDWEMERIHRISVRKLMDARLGPSLRRKLLISNVLESVLCSVDSSYYVGRTENETDVEMDEGKNELKKNRPNQNRNEGTKDAKETGEDKKHLKVSKLIKVSFINQVEHNYQVSYQGTFPVYFLKIQSLPMNR